MIKALPWGLKYTAPPIAVALLLLLIYLLPAGAKSALTFERMLIVDGQWWRLITGQWVHWKLTHGLMNIAGVWLVWLLFAAYATGWRYGLTIMLISFASSMGMFLFTPTIEYYVGFSGTLYGLFAWGSVQDIRCRVPFGRLLFLGVVIKVCYDLFFTSVSIIGQSADNLAVTAHFYGVVGGVLIALISSRKQLT